MNASMGVCSSSLSAISPTVGTCDFLRESKRLRFGNLQTLVVQVPSLPGGSSIDLLDPMFLASLSIYDSIK